MKFPVVQYTEEEERAHVISHGIGLVLAIIAFGAMLWNSDALTGWGVTGVVVYGLCLMLSYATSTIYHGTTDEQRKILFKKLDHIAIYFLISGSYTVLILNRLLNAEGYMFLAALWVMTAIGVWFKARYVHRFKVTSTLIYVFMGYIMVVDPWLFFGVLNTTAKYLLVVSGFFYTVGAGFYLWKSLKWSHFIWHLFVIFGAAAHFAAIYMELFT